MLFKNIRTFRVAGDLPFTFEELEKVLATKRARPCAAQESTHHGFAAPIGKGDDAPLVHVVNNDCALIRVQIDSLLLPDSVVSKAVKNKVAEIEESHNRKVRKRERDQIKDEVIQAYMPRAFPLDNSSYLIIDKASGLIYCNTPTAKRAEDMLSLIREVVGSLPVRPLRTKLEPAISMTEWMKTKTPPDDFSLLGDAQLSDLDSGGGVLRAKKQDLGDEALLALIEEGRHATELRIAYKDQFSMSINNDVALKSISYENVFEEKASADAGDDADSLFNSNLSLMVLTLREMMPKLLTNLGGEDLPATAA
jgi:recombination associated protein RdgC